MLPQLMVTEQQQWQQCQGQGFLHCLPTSVTSAGTSLEQSSPELRASPQGPGGAHMGSPEQGEGSLPQQPHLERIL